MPRLMTLVRERRKQKPLRLTLPQISATEFWQPSVSSPSTLSSTSSSSGLGSGSGSPGIDNLSDLEKLGVLGHGNGGTVYKVYHKQTGAIYALKVQRFVEQRANFQHDQAFCEAEILQRVDSQFVVKCYGVFDNGSFADTDGVGNNNLCFVMEYMEGGSLYELLLKHTTLSEQVISCIARSVLQGLQYLHNMNIVHRDIKPSNLLINCRGQIKIADFGVSHVVDQGNAEECCSSCSCMGGTCAYMSPERIDAERWNGDCTQGFAGDVWSLGVVMMECYVGHFPLIQPWQKLDWATLVCAICFGDRLEMPSSASMEFQSFVSRCLERDWRVRGTVDELLAHPFVTNCQDGIVQELV